MELMPESSFRDHELSCVCATDDNDEMLMFKLRPIEEKRRYALKTVDAVCTAYSALKKW